MAKRVYLFLLILSELILFSSCERKDVKYEYYSDPEKSIKSKGEYSEGVLDGNLTYYYPDGKREETSKWSKGIRNGLTIAYDSNGVIRTEYLYNKGKVSAVKIYYETGTLKYDAHINENNIFYQEKNYDKSGKLLEMSPLVRLNRDTLTLGDTLTIIGSISNVVDKKYQSGTLIVGNKQDTTSFIAETSSDSNVYKILIGPKKRGHYQLMAQFSFPGDSLALFTSFKIVVE